MGANDKVPVICVCCRSERPGMPGRLNPCETHNFLLTSKKLNFFFVGVGPRAYPKRRIFRRIRAPQGYNPTPEMQSQYC